MTKIEVKKLKDQKKAKRIIAFLLSENAFQQTWAPGEAEIVKKAVLASINNGNHCYWYVEDHGKIVGAMGVRENDYKSGGYEMNQDYLAVHKNYRRRGIGSLLMEEVEKFVKSKKGRYLHIVSCDIDSYRPARAFFRRKGFKKVCTIPDYYVQDEGRIDFFKKIGSLLGD